jgi:hypothetical protein
VPSKSLQMFAAWSNYNLTVGQPRAPYGTLGMTIENLFSLHCSDVDEGNPIAAVAATGTVLLDYLAELEKLRTWGSPAGFPPRNFAAATIGQAWSFAPLVGTPVAQLLGAGLSWCGKPGAAIWDARFKGDRDKLMIAGGGTRLRELVSVAERAGLSLPTGGSHLGQSLAGSFGTGTHGSRLGAQGFAGGLQNMVRAMHIVTGPQSHVWLQPARSPVLSEDEIAKITLRTPDTRAAPGKDIACTSICDDDHFANALIHLGGMGIINAVVIELTSIEEFNVLAIDRKVDCAWLDGISGNRFDEIADGLGLDGESLQFYELTIDPHEPFGDHAAHLVYTGKTTKNLIDEPQGKRPALADAICNLAAVLPGSDAAMPQAAAFAKDSAPAIELDSDQIMQAARVELQKLLAQSQSSTVFEHYRKVGNFQTFPGPINPDASAIASGSWGKIHGDEITGGIPGALYNASFAIDRQHTTAAIQAITAAVTGLAPSFVFTLRFVDNAAGTLAFTRFAQSTVIEIDGLSPLAIGLAWQQYLASTPTPDAYVQAAFSLLSTTLEAGAMAVRRVLSAGGIDYSMHWAKLGNLDAVKVAADYRNGQITAWQATRDQLLGPEGRVLFSNPALEKYGLIANPVAPAQS